MTIRPILLPLAPLALLVLLVVPILGCPRRAPAAAAPPPVWGPVGDFTLQDQDGRPFGRADLNGRIWVMDFIFTRCPSFCPQMTRTLEELAQAWRHDEGVSFLSFTVDGAHDTPEVLRAYAAQVQPPIPRWTLLTGDPAAIRSLCLQSFKLAIGENMDERGDITHSTRFVLVDAEGNIRGAYEALDPDSRARLEADLRFLLKNNK